jgi:glycine dehydrogenase subunit 2
MASCAESWRSRRRWKHGARIAAWCWSPKARTAPIPRQRHFAASRSRIFRQPRTGASISPRSKARLGPDVAGVMITNPNTCGLFEARHEDDRDAVHAAGGYVYCDGANFNAIVGKVRPGDLGVDAMHINLHKTFSTPHGGGGPGSGPVVLSEALAPFAPLPFVEHGSDGRFVLVEENGGRASWLQLRPHGLLPRPDGHVHARADLYAQPRRGRAEAGGRGRVLNANYVLRSWRMCSTPPSPPAGRACTRRCSTTRGLADGLLDARLRQGADRRGLSIR